MLRRILLHTILCALLLSGCTSAVPGPASVSPAATPPALAPSATRALTATETQDILHPTRTAMVTPTAALFAPNPTATPAADYPAQTEDTTAEVSYPAPASGPITVPAAQPFHDCARTPGVIGCDPTAPPLPGRVAFYEDEHKSLVVFDLKTGQGWSVAIPEPHALEWSPDGSQLLVRMNYSLEAPYVYDYLVFGREGNLIQQVTRGEFVDWQPQGAELRTSDERKIARSTDGAEAWLEGRTGDKTLHFRPSGTAAWKTAALELSPWEHTSELYGWIPGTPNVILIHGPGSVNNHNMHGHNHFMFNTQTEELRYLKDFNGHLDPQFSAVQGSDLAMIQLSWGLGSSSLAILDGKTGLIDYPLPKIIGVGDSSPYGLLQLAWQPASGEKEGLFAMMVNLLGADQPGWRPIPLFPKRGIYLYDRTSGEAQILREVPEDRVGGNFHWTADGQYLLYSLGPIDSPESAQASLFVRQIDTGEEWLLLDDLENPGIFLYYVSLSLIAVHME